MSLEPTDQNQHSGPRASSPEFIQHFTSEERDHLQTWANIARLPDSFLIGDFWEWLHATRKDPAFRSMAKKFYNASHGAP